MLNIKNAFIKDSNKNKIITNVYWATLGKVVNIVIGILVGVLIARYLGPTDFGLMNYVISYISLFSVFSNFGMESIEIRELAKDNLMKNKILGTAFCIRLVLSFITIIAVFITSYIFEASTNTKLLIWIYSISLIFGSFEVIRNYFTSIVLNEYVVKTEISRNVIGAFIKIALLYFHAPLIWFIIALTFDFLLVASGYVLSYRTKIDKIKAWTFDSGIAKMLLKESFPLLLSGTAIIIYQKIDQIMISNMIDNASVGQFAIASKITELAIFIPMVVGQTITPVLVKARMDNIELYYKKRQQFMDIIVWSGIGMSFLMSVFAYPAIKILYGNKYLDAIPVLQIMAWKTLFVALFSASGQIIIIENNQKYAVFRNIIGCIVCIVLNFIFIPVWGIIGSAIASIITMIFTGYLSNRIISPYQNLFKIQNKSLFSGLTRILKNS